MAKAEKPEPKPSPDTFRAQACSPSTLRDNVLTNLAAGAYSRPEDIETDLLELERREAAQK